MRDGEALFTGVQSLLRSAKGDAFGGCCSIGTFRKRPLFDQFIMRGLRALRTDQSGSSISVRVRAFASYTLTWIGGNLFLSSKPAFDAASEVAYSVLNFPSISRT